MRMGPMDCGLALPHFFILADCLRFFFHGSLSIREGFVRHVYMSKHPLSLPFNILFGKFLHPLPGPFPLPPPQPRGGLNISEPCFNDPLGAFFFRRVNSCSTPNTRRGTDLPMCQPGGGLTRGRAGTLPNVKMPIVFTWCLKCRFFCLAARKPSQVNMKLAVSANPKRGCS